MNRIERRAFDLGGPSSEIPESIKSGEELDAFLDRMDGAHSVAPEDAVTELYSTPRGRRTEASRSQESGPAAQESAESNSTSNERRGIGGLLLSVRDRYRAFKRSVVERTDATFRTGS